MVVEILYDERDWPKETSMSRAATASRITPGLRRERTQQSSEAPGIHLRPSCAFMISCGATSGS